MNDATYAPLIERTGFASVYDMTDDWLLAPSPRREVDRLRKLEETLFTHADRIVVCSPGLLASRGSRRALTLIPNGVDAEHFRRPQSRPADLPVSPVAVYVGSLHEARLDVDLTIKLAESLPELSVTLVGPNSLGMASRARLAEHKTITILGARPYDRVPAYLQHATIIIVPHIISPFTESLDPIKAYECLASSRPTVATPVAGFRELSENIVVAPRETFAAAVREVLAADDPGRETTTAISWHDRALAFEQVLLDAQGGPRRAPSARLAPRAGFARNRSRH